MSSRPGRDRGLPVVVVGAGAAGLVAAIFAASHSRVLLLERTADGGRKILISGGGRCNVLPAEMQPERFVTDSSPNLLRRMLRAWPLAEQRGFFEREVGIPLKLEAETAKLFPVSDRARDVRDGLVDLARRHGVEPSFETTLTELRPTGAGWTVVTSRGEFAAGAVIVATGGLSVPATGSDGMGLRLLEGLGIRAHPTYPALTPLLAADKPHAALAGVSLPVEIRASWQGRTARSRGGFLFTHRGYSGPAVLDVSHLAVRSRLQGDSADGAARLRVAWTDLDAGQWTQLIGGAGGRLLNVLAHRLPRRLAERLLQDAGVPADRLTAELRRSERTRLLEALTSFPLPWTGDEGYRKAEVTGGGVALEEVDPRTLECRSRPGLFLCGEVLDAFGPIGGHNFAWAWATGRTAGLGCSPGG